MGKWKTVVEDLGLASTWSFTSPAQKDRIDLAESHLNHPLPEELAALLLETNGIQDTKNGTRVVWDLEKIKQDNAFLRTNPDMRELYMSFDSLLFFGDNGGGDQFGIALTGTGMEVFAWDHENDSRICVASGLGQYLERSAKGDGPDWFRDL